MKSPEKRRSRPISGTAKKNRLPAITCTKVTGHLGLVKIVETLRLEFWNGDVSARLEIVRVIEGAL